MKPNPYYMPYTGFYENEDDYFDYGMNGNNFYYKKKDDPDEINPYKVLNVSPFASLKECRYV